MSTQSLEARVAALEAMIADRDQQDESLQPNYLSINPSSGIVTASFNGVFTGNLAIPETVTNFANPQFQPGGAVEWDNAGVHREFIQGTRLQQNEPTAHILTLGSDTRSIVNRAYVRTYATDAGADAPGSSGIYLTAEDGVFGGFDDELLIDSTGRSGLFTRIAAAINNNNTGTLTNAGAFAVPTGVNVTVQIPQQPYCLVMVSARCVIDVLSNSNAYVALVVNGGGIYDIRGSGLGGIVQAVTGGPNPPIVSYLIATDPHNNVGNMTNFGTSGTGDFSGVGSGGTGISPGGNAQVFGGGWIPIWIPNNNFYHNPTFQLAYQVDAGGSYQVVAQTLSVLF